MSFRRATHPLDPEAVKAANDAVAAETGGRPIRTDEYELRKKWMDAYEAAGGEVEEAGVRRKKPGDTCEKCKPPKSVTARIVSVTFVSDHLDAGGAKLIKRALPQHITVKWKTGVDSTGRETFEMREHDSLYGDAFTEFKKPEWDDARGGSSDSHPISHTRNQNVKVKIQIDFTVTPDGESASLTRVKGSGPGAHLTFEKSLSKTVGTERVEVDGLVSKGKLPNFVTRLEDSIDWVAEVDGEDKSIGSTSHVIYITLDKPFGKMDSPSDNAFREVGTDQIVTESRLAYSVEAADKTGSSDEQECVDAIFVKLMNLGVGYVLDRRWEHDPKDHTGVLPKPALHHYFWLCNTALGQGECHNIAAAMAVACRILGVKGSFEVGYMYPWPSRDNNHPVYSKSGLATSSGKLILGKYNERHRRDHSLQGGHGEEVLGFLDKNGFGNNFEGVVAYKGTALYAIGDDVFDSSSTEANENATSYYAQRGNGAEIQTGTGGAGWRRGAITDWKTGLFDLSFWDPDSGANCKQPYPWLTTEKAYPSGEKHVPFRWED